jgi:hypothetical protein
MIDFKTNICKGGDRRGRLTEQEHRRKDVEYQIRERAPKGARCSGLSTIKICDFRCLQEMTSSNNVNRYLFILCIVVLV